MNYLVISPMPNEKYLVQLMLEKQYQVLKEAGVIGENSTIYSIEGDYDEIAQTGILGIHTLDEIVEFVKDNDNTMEYVEGPVIADKGGDI